MLLCMMTHHLLSLRSADTVSFSTDSSFYMTGTHIRCIVGSSPRFGVAWHYHRRHTPTRCSDLAVCSMHSSMTKTPGYARLCTNRTGHSVRTARRPSILVLRKTARISRMPAPRQRTRTSTARSQRRQACSHGNLRNDASNIPSAGTLHKSLIRW